MPVTSEKIVSLQPDRPLLIRHLGDYLGGVQGPLALLVVQIRRGREFGTLFGFRKLEDVVQQIAERLGRACRHSDRILRIGEYEYALILPGLINEGHAVLAANKVLRTLAEPLVIDKQRVSMGACIGVALCPDHAKLAEPLLHCAELARADAERRGQPFTIYNESASAELASHWGIENELDQALEGGELETFYQAKISLPDGQLAGAETLVRWRSPTRGLVPPDKFIPVATQSGQISALTWSVLNMALQQASDWPTRFGPLPVSVNIAPALLDDPTLVSRVADAMNVWGVRSNRLILEVTESGIMRDPEQSFETLRRLTGTGALISIDDFGTGYSSLANFRNMPVSELKIDKGFVIDMLKNPGDEKIVRVIIDLARTFRLSVVAEGVESAGILKTLAGMQCDYAQGYYISKPLPADAFVKFIQDYRPPAM